MLLFDKKKTLSQIMGPAPGERVREDPRHMIAKEAIAAVHNHDHAGFAAATKALFDEFSRDPDQDGDKHEDATGKEIE